MLLRRLCREVDNRSLLIETHSMGKDRNELDGWVDPIRFPPTRLIPIVRQSLRILSPSCQHPHHFLDIVQQLAAPASTDLCLAQFQSRQALFTPTMARKSSVLGKRDSPACATPGTAALSVDLPVGGPMPLNDTPSGNADDNTNPPNGTSIGDPSAHASDQSDRTVSLLDSMDGTVPERDVNENTGSSSVATPATEETAQPAEAPRLIAAGDNVVQEGTPAKPSNARPVSIRDLRPTLTGEWELVGRVVSRGGLRKWDNVRGSGQLISFLIVDSSGQTVSATLFNQGIDRFDSIIQNGSICTFSGGKIKVPNRSFSSAACEVAFDHRAAICEAAADQVATYETISVGTSIPKLAHVRDKTTVSFVGVVMQVDPVKSITSSKGKSCFKRDLLVVDDSMLKVICTVWGSLAREELSERVGVPVLIERATVSDFNGRRSINVGIGAAAHFDPALPEAVRLRAWFEGVHDPSAFTFLAPSNP